MTTINYNNRLEGFQGNTKSLLVTVYDSDGELYDLTDYDAYLYARKYPIRANSPIDVSIFSRSIDASAGAIWFDFTSNDLSIDDGDYVYEVIIDDGGSVKHTVIQDRLTIKESISI